MSTMDHLRSESEAPSTTGFAWHALCTDLGRDATCSINEVLEVLAVEAVPLELARRLLRPTSTAA